MDENEFKKGMWEAISMIGQHTEKKTPIQVVCKKLDDRLTYIKNKLSNCKGYSESEKQIRYEEILNVLGIIKETFNVDV